jgi:hypothetical protein
VDAADGMDGELHIALLCGGSLPLSYLLLG